MVLETLDLVSHPPHCFKRTRLGTMGTTTEGRTVSTERMSWMTRTMCSCPQYPRFLMTSQRMSKCMLRTLMACLSICLLYSINLVFAVPIVICVVSLKLDRDQRITKAMESLSCTANFLITFGHMAIVLAVGYAQLLLLFANSLQAGLSLIIPNSFACSLTYCTCP